MLQTLWATPGLTRSGADLKTQMMIPPLASSINFIGKCETDNRLTDVLGWLRLCNLYLTGLDHLSEAYKAIILEAISLYFQTDALK